MCSLLEKFLISVVSLCQNSQFINCDFTSNFVILLQKIYKVTNIGTFPLYSHQRKKDMLILDFKSLNTIPATELVPYCFWSQLLRSWYISGALRRSSHPFFKNLTFEVKDYHFFFSGGAKVEKYSNILPTNDHNISFCFSIRALGYK